MKNKMFRCWSVMCHVWYFGGGPDGENTKCPGCGEDGTLTSASESADIRFVWAKDKLD